MRVLVVADIVGGVRTFTLELTRQLLRRGVKVDLALLGQADRHLADTLSDLDPCWWEARDLRLEWMDSPWQDVERTADWVRELVAERRPDVLHMNTFTPVHDRDVPVLLTVHSDVTTWWRTVRGEQPPPRWERYRRLVASALARAGLVSAPTQALLDQLRSAYGWNGPAAVVPNGRSLPAAELLSRRREPIVLSVGRLWDEAKNVALLGRAAEQVRGRVVLIGAGPPEGISSATLLGELPEGEVLSWLSRARVFAEPARYEPFGLAALEAGLSGCALVLGDIPSLREVWGPAASYVAPHDPDALARAVNGLLEDEHRWALMAQRAQRRAKRYTAGAMTDGYLDAYAGLIGARAPA